MARKKWSDIKARVPAEVLERAAAKTRDFSAGIRLDELRRLVGVTQEELASRLGTNQPSVSKLERRDDVYVSSLRQVVAALGGTLEISARFAGFTIPLNHLGSGGREPFTAEHAQPAERTIRVAPYAVGTRINLYWAGVGTVYQTLTPFGEKTADSQEFAAAAAYDGNETEQAA